MTISKHLRVRYLLIWLFSKQLSDISAYINTIIMSIYALNLTASPLALAIILLLRMAGSVVGALFVPILSKRVSHGTILMACDIGSALSMVVFAVVPASFDRYLIYIVAFLIGSFQGSSHIALYSQSPYFLGFERRHKMNAIFGCINGISVIAGGVAASLIYLYIPVKSIFLLDGITFLFTAVIFGQFGKKLTVHEKLELQGRRFKQKQSSFFPVSKFLSAAKISVFFFGLLLAFRFIEAFGSSAHNVGFPILSEQYSSTNPAFLLGWIMALWGAGKMVSTFATPEILRTLEKNGQDISLVFSCSLLLTFIFFYLVFLPGPFLLILLCAFVAGIFDTSTETVYYSILQTAPAKEKDKIISVSYFIERLGMGVGILLAGYTFSIATVETTTYLFYGGSILICLSFIIVSRRHKPT